MHYFYLFARLEGLAIETQQSAANNYQLLDEVEQSIVICQWLADQLFAEAER